jgi:hypothetical protein
MSQAELKCVYGLAATAAHLGDAARQTAATIDTVRLATGAVASQVGEAEAGRSGEVSDVDGGWFIAAGVVSGSQEG